jgi:hypothetical protein
MLYWISVAAAVPPLLLLVRHRRRAAARARGAAAAAAFLGAPIAATPALKALEPDNDDLIAPVRDAVEHDLRRAGYLR